MKIYDKSELTGFFEVKPTDQPLAETKENVYIGDILRIDCELYSVCMVAARSRYAVVNKLNIIEFPDNPKEQVGTNEIVCPYCLEQTEGFEMDDSDDDYECPCCGSRFSYQREVIVAYNSQPISKNENILEVE
ncbi:hypothetical protein [Mediterraneibacter gnavus]|uniref:hypothetical protein n=1 Tax=Mediterraneibacter gnavus TaxID=33038 RepID=UPI000463520E|nr:hypothetical protein [Mediterraneibacter gnavus]